MYFEAEAFPLALRDDSTPYSTTLESLWCQQFLNREPKKSHSVSFGVIKQEHSQRTILNKSPVAVYYQQVLSPQFSKKESSGKLSQITFTPLIYTASTGQMKGEPSSTGEGHRGTQRECVCLRCLLLNKPKLESHHRTGGREGEIERESASWLTIKERILY